jgi:hypothetical protein
LGIVLGLGGEASSQEAASSASASAWAPTELKGLDFGPRSETKKTFASKVFGRSSSGILSNVGSVQGSGFSFGGANVGLLYFLSERLAVGAAYKIETNFSSVPLKGFDLISRYYFLGDGTLVTLRDARGHSTVRHRSWSPYVGVEYSNRQYYIEVDPEADQASDRALSGSISAVSAATGVDYRISQSWEFTIEANLTLLPFVGSDPRVKIRWMLASFGLNYVF